MGGDEWDAEQRHRTSRRRFSLLTLGLASAVLVAGALAHATVPTALALSDGTLAAGAPVEGADARADALTRQLADASGRTLADLAQTLPAASAGPTGAPSAPVVGGAADGDFTATQQDLSEAEAAAAAGLAVTDEDRARQRDETAAASKAAASADAAAAQAIDDAVNAAIAAAQADTSLLAAGGGVLGDVPGLGSGGSTADGKPTSTEEVLAQVRMVFPAAQVGNAMAVSRCESGHANRVGSVNPNGTRDYGVFQLNDGGTLQAALRRIGVGFNGVDQARAKALNTATNVAMAHAIWQERGWQPWVCAANLQIVAGLYQRNAGPMAGRYDDYGRAR